jgi:hypothetical protein
MKAAMVYEVLIQPIGEILPAEPVLEEPNPGLEDKELLARAQELCITKRVLLHRIRNGAA